MKTKTLDDIKDDFYGKAGTLRRKKLEKELEALRHKIQNEQELN